MLHVKAIFTLWRLGIYTWYTQHVRYCMNCILHKKHNSRQQSQLEQCWPQTHLSLWQARLPVSGLVACFLHRFWASACLCCLVTVRSGQWFMQIGRKGLVGQSWYVARPSLGQCTEAKAKEALRAYIANQEHWIPFLSQISTLIQYIGLVLLAPSGFTRKEHNCSWPPHGITLIALTGKALNGLLWMT